MKQCSLCDRNVISKYYETVIKSEKKVVCVECRDSCNHSHTKGTSLGGDNFYARQCTRCGKTVASPY